MSLTEQFKQHVKQEELFHPGDQLLLAVSGGVDSVVLAELCSQAGYAFSIAHCNFRLREKESDRDAQFVKGLAEKYGVEFFSKEFDTRDYAEKNKLSIQEAARELRYTWFDELITHHASPAGFRGRITNVLTAHHANDNVETVVMNFFRGTGLGGLKGIDAKSGKLIRPLLIFSKQQLVDFAKENKLEFVEDSSNKSSKYTRNLFRNEIIPAIEKAYPGVTQNLFSNIERFREIHKLYQFATDKLINKLVKISGNERRVPVKQLMEFNNRALIYQLISSYGFTEKQVAELEKLAAAESGKFIQSPDQKHRIIRHRHWFIISPVNSTEVDHYIIETEGQAKCGEKNIAITRLTYSGQLIPDSLNIAMLDAKVISFPLVLRKWKTGDYFYPLGMRKKKKLARLFIDLKLSKAAKEKVWVLESDKKILWVVCHRIDDRFRITEKTKEVLKITFT